MIVLTAEQRYRQAVVKARIIARRDIREALEGRRDWVPCSGDRERAFIIAEIDRAYRAGLSAGRAA